MQNALLDTLKNTFGYTRFREKQVDIIDELLNGKHVLAIMPTGSGKSILYQLPALLFDGLTVVISPLIALMKDQVDALQRKNIAAAYINSTLTRKERESRYKQVADGAFKLIYVAPERFRKPEFIQALAKQQISLLAVDEAHCISEWGHDFRPDYTRIKDFRKQMGHPVTIALTATATPHVQKDIIKNLGLESANVATF
ncbi:MAG: RecQ family ATP-dependent DNA helicase, partial [Caldithrix sp.]|nr:RecQ family ATP-dependent DNA helicase [Caldithrix sp.]